VQFHPESVLSEHGRDMVAAFLAADAVRWVDPEGLVAALAARHSAVFWLDGAGGVPRSSVVGWLEPDEVGLALAPGEEPFGPTARLLADLQSHERLVGWFGYAARTDLPAQRSAPGPVPDSCGCVPAATCSSTTTGRW
jgi:para-aminobenzoate synthetase